MSAWGIAFTATVLVVILLFAHNTAFAGVKPDDPAALARATSLGKLIRTIRDRPVHIVYVHGMRADGPGASHAFRNGLCHYVPELCTSGPARREPQERRHYTDVSEVPPLISAA